MLKVYDEAKAAGCLTYLVTDSGKTEFDGVPTHTAIAIGPNQVEQIDAITGGLKLY